MANLANRVDALRMKIERRARRELRREFSKFALDASENAGQFTDATLRHKDRLVEILGGIYAQAIPLGVELAEEQLVKASPAQIAGRVKAQIRKIAKGIKQSETTEALIDRLLNEWIETRAFDQATSISSTSRSVAQRALQESVAEGLGEAETARAIRGAVDSLSRARSLTIARTESHGAMMNANLEGAVELGAESKEWVAIEDDRTRETHVEADTQVVPLDSAFLVGSAELMFPGDPSGPPEETINCRCAVAYS